MQGRNSSITQCHTLAVPSGSNTPSAEGTGHRATASPTYEVEIHQPHETAVEEAEDHEGSAISDLVCKFFLRTKRFLNDTFREYYVLPSRWSLVASWGPSNRSKKVSSGWALQGIFPAISFVPSDCQLYWQKRWLDLPLTSRIFRLFLESTSILHGSFRKLEFGTIHSREGIS